MTSLEVLDKQPQMSGVNDILDDIKSGKKIYDEETEREMESLEREVLSEARMQKQMQQMPMQQQQMQMQQMQQQMYQPEYGRQEKEFTEEKSIFSKVFSFLKIFTLTYLIVAIFNSSLTLDIISSNFSWMLLDYDTHSWLSTLLRTLFTTITLMITYLLF